MKPHDQDKDSRTHPGPHRLSRLSGLLTGQPRRDSPLLPAPGLYPASARSGSRLGSILGGVIVFCSVYACLSWILDQPNTLELDPVIDPVTLQILPSGDPFHRIRATSQVLSTASSVALQLENEQRQTDFHLRIAHAVNRNITKAWRNTSNRNLTILNQSGSDRNFSKDMTQFMWYKGDEGLKNNRPVSKFKCDISNQRKQNSLLFLGIFTTPEAFVKRNLIRTLLKPDLPPINHHQDTTSSKKEEDSNRSLLPLIDLVFISGQPINEYWKYLIDQENELYNDTIVLKDVVEDNIDGGKTYEYFKWVANGADGRWDDQLNHESHGLQDRDPRVKLVGKPKFVMKADDDTFLVIPNLIKAFKDLDCNQNIYWGTSQGSNPLFDPYFRGLGYAMSWPLVEWIGTSNLSIESKVGIEDARVGAWLTEINTEVEKVERIDVGWKMGDWNQMEIDENSIGLHWLKAVEWFPMVKVKVLEAWKKSGQTYRWDWHIKPEPSSQ